jgi:hypothetical protein
MSPISGLGATPENYFRQDANNLTTKANPFSNSKRPEGVGATYAVGGFADKQPAELNLTPSSGEIFVNTPNNLVTIAYKRLSAPPQDAIDEDYNSTGTVDDMGVLKGGTSKFSDRSIELTYARLRLDRDISKAGNLPPIGLGVTMRHRNQKYTDDYKTPSRSGWSWDLAARAQFAKKYSWILALQDWGTRLTASGCESDHFPTNIYNEFEWLAFHDQLSSVKVNANATYGLYEKQFTDATVGIKGALKKCVEGELGLSVNGNGKFSPVLGFGLSDKDRHLGLNSALKYSEGAMYWMMSLTGRIGGK